MSDSALQKRMTHTDRVLTKLCSDMLQKSGAFVVGGISLGDLQRKMIQSSVSVEEAIGVFQEIDNAVKKARTGKDGTSYSAGDFAWFTVEAHNRGVLDEKHAKTFHTFALNFADFSTKEVRCYKQQMMNAFTKSVQKLDFPKSMSV